MDKAYWLRRESDSMEHARAATLPDVKLIHYELAQRYRVKAADVQKALREKRTDRAREKLNMQLKTAFDPLGH